MAASTWRMNGLRRSMTGVLLLCALLFSRKVMCQVDGTAPTQPASNTAATDPGAGPVSSAKPDPTVFTSTLESSGDSGTSAAASAVVPTNRHNDQQGTLENPHAPSSVASTKNETVAAKVECVNKGVIPEQKAVKVEVTETKDCETTKRIFEENLKKWCLSNTCNLKIFQDGNNVLLTSSDVKLSSLAGALQGEALKGKLGGKNVDVPASSDSSVFVGILVTGLLAALGIIVGYFKCQLRPDPKGAMQAEEAYPVDQENQGNTLASEAPLNPPPETQEKPSINGESLEAVKTETSPPTNGHSTAKTADTEL